VSPLKSFFPKSQLFGFTGTPIFAQNSQALMIEEDEASCKTTKDIFEKELHNYTITHAIDDGNVLKFHIDYFKASEESDKHSKKAVVNSILSKHNKTTADKKFNSLFATASINDAIEYFRLFKQKKRGTQRDYRRL